MKEKSKRNAGVKKGIESAGLHTRQFVDWLHAAVRYLVKGYQDEILKLDEARANTPVIVLRIITRIFLSGRQCVRGDHFVGSRDEFTWMKAWVTSATCTTISLRVMHRTLPFLVFLTCLAAENGG